MSPLFILLSMTACTNDCIHMCQRVDKWLNECGYSWEATFQKEGWASIDDCYDDHWEVKEEKERSCEKQAKRWDREECS